MKSSSSDENWHFSRSEGDEMIGEHHSEFANFEHAYINTYIQIADTKAAVSFGVTSALLAYLLQNEKFLQSLKPYGMNVNDILSSILLVTLVISSFLSISVILPRLTGFSHGYVFWRAVAERKSSFDYFQELKKLSHPDLIRCKIEHCYEIASVCNKKYRVLLWSMWSGAAGVGLFGLWLFIATIAS
jgi:hypothetical protein